MGLRINMVWATIGVVCCWGTISFFLCLFETETFSTIWTGQGIFRFDTLHLGMNELIGSLILDVFILSIPLPIILRLNMPIKRRIEIIFIL
ncbi:hypothetical protein GGS20DRAFT_591170 [Poronia punctata]|nr:hypothetical protein GGS20DRAFT_591170 [Poronia punctata]